jgi:hypothetical protein
MSEQPFNPNIHKRGRDDDPRWLPFIAVMLGTLMVGIVAAIVSLGRAAINGRERPGHD